MTHDTRHGAVAGGIGVTLGIFAAANVSGGHINPAVTAGFLDAVF